MEVYRGNSELSRQSRTYETKWGKKLFKLERFCKKLQVMFKNEFQGGPYVDVFSVQGKNPLSKLKVTGPSSAVRKEFHNDIRTFIISLQGDSSRNKITFPKNSKHSLHLTQQFLVFQIFLQSGQSFSLEAVLVTQSNSKVRLIFSSSIKEIVINAHHVKMPCSLVECDTWVSLCLDLQQLVSTYFEGSAFAHVESITISANCKLKRIFTVKERPNDATDFPKPLNFPSNMNCPLQILDWDCFEDGSINVRYGTGNIHKRTPHKLSTNDISNTHIAFGSRIGNTKGTNSTPAKQIQSKYSNSDETQSKDLSLTSRGIEILPSKHSSKPSSKSLIKEDKPELDLNNNNIVVENSKPKFQPRPPDKDAKKNTRRPRVVKSADVRSRDTSRSRSSDKPKPQVFSKSADSRNRRKPSDVEIEDVLPSILKAKKGISRSAADLERAEVEISTKRDLHFKSKSLTVLPKIGSSSRNNRYSRTNVSQEEAQVTVAITGSNDNVFVADEDDELLALADEHEIDEYLKLRTRSSCRDDESMSSCNSANSDLYVYSSRPRSVIKQRKHSQRNSDSRSEMNNNNNRSDSRSEMNTDKIEISASSDISKVESSTTNSDVSNVNSSSTRDESNVETNIKTNQSTNLVGQSVVDRNNNETFTKPNADGVGDVELSWEYSESTSMLVIPKEFKTTSSSSSTDRQVELVELPSDDIVTDEAEPIKISSESTETSSEEKTSEVISVIPSSFVMHDSCDSDSMSWLRNSQDAANLSVAMTNTLDKMKSPQMALRQRLKEQLGSLIVQSKDMESESDCLSDCSDDTTYTDLPPKRFRNYRYQDEIQSISSTLDLSATIPATPHVGEQARYDENNNEIGGPFHKRGEDNEELLDLMFDPILNCYYDPVSHKYYELN